MARAPKQSNRACPGDFEVVFVEQGRFECEAWYRAGRITINAWLTQCGKARLLKKRAAYVRHLRDRRKTPPPAPPAAPPADPRRVNLKLALLAADHLRSIRNGGWAISSQPDALFIVGTRLRSAAELVDMAERAGFDRAAAMEQIEIERERAETNG